jgi:hypothetical protein
MTITIKNKSPSCVDEILLNDVELKSVLTYDEYQNLLDEDDQLEKWKILEEFGTRFITNETWLEVYDANKLRLDIKSHDILNGLFFSPDQFEGIETEILNNTFIAITASVAQGQGGGFAIIDIKNEKWISSTNNGFRNNFIFVPKHNVFLSACSLSTYTWYVQDLAIIDQLGRIAYLDIYSCVNDLESLEQKIENNLKKLGFIRTNTKPDNKGFFYYSENDEIYLSINNKHFICDFTKIMNLVEFRL